MALLGITRPPGEQNPGKYPFVGANYKRLGEQPGFLYNPWSDTYQPDPKAVNQYKDDQGLTQKSPGLLSQMIPLVAATGAIEATKGVGKYIGEKVPNFLPNVTEAAKQEAAKQAASKGGGLLTIGSQAGGELTGSAGADAATAATNAAWNAGADAATNAAAPVATQAVESSPGLMSLGSDTALAAAPEAANGGLFSLGAGFGLPAAAVVGATALGAKSAYDTLRGKSDNSLPGLIGRTSLGIATGGISELARPLLMHKSISEQQDKRWGGLIDQGIKGAAEQKQALDNLGDMAGKMINSQGQKVDWNFNDALQQVKSGQTDQFRGVYGNLKTFGNDWNRYTPDQQNKIVSALANANLYQSKKGDVHITDEDAARKIKDQVLAGTYVTPVAKVGV